MLPKGKSAVHHSNINLSFVYILLVKFQLHCMLLSRHRKANKETDKYGKQPKICFAFLYIPGIFFLVLM